jgi:hypothetical protein
VTIPRRAIPCYLASYEAEPVTTDEELSQLEQQLRRLKIEYEMYFNNPAKRPPTDVEWKVLAILRKFSDGGRMNFAQRFRYNALAQQYAVQSDLWRKKSRIREEGYRRPQDALLSVQGVRIFEDKDKEEKHASSEAVSLEINEETENETLEAAAAAAAASVDKPMAPWPVAGTKLEEPKAAVPAPAKPAAKAAKPATKPAAKQPYSAQLTDVEKDRKHVESLYHALVEAKKNAGEKLGDAASFDSFSMFVKKKTDQIRKQYSCEAVEYSVELEAGKVKLKAKAGSKA